MIVAKDSITVAIKNELAEAEEVVDCTTDVEDDFTIAFNTKFLIEALKNSFSDGKNVLIQMDTAHSPISISNENQEILAIVLPVRF